MCRPGVYLWQHFRASQLSLKTKDQASSKWGSCFLSRTSHDSPRQETKDRQLLCAQTSRLTECQIERSCSSPLLGKCWLPLHLLGTSKNAECRVLLSTPSHASCCPLPCLNLPPCFAPTTLPCPTAAAASGWCFWAALCSSVASVLPPCSVSRPAAYLYLEGYQCLQNLSTNSTCPLKPLHPVYYIKKKCA